MPFLCFCFSWCTLFICISQSGFFLARKTCLCLDPGEQGSSPGFWGSTRTAGGAGSSLTSVMLSLQIWCVILSVFHERSHLSHLGPAWPQYRNPGMHGRRETGIYFILSKRFLHASRHTAMSVSVHSTGSQLSHHARVMRWVCDRLLPLACAELSVPSPVYTWSLYFQSCPLSALLLLPSVCAPCLWVCFCLFVPLVCSLGSTYKWDHPVFVFPGVTYHTQH